MSLVEVLVGLAVLATITMGLVAALTLAMHLSKLAEERTVATALAAERLQQIAALPFHPAADFTRYKLPEETAITGTPRILRSVYGSIPEHAAFRREVDLYYDTPYSGTLTVEVKVYWEHVERGEKEHGMVTFINAELQ